ADYLGNRPASEFPFLAHIGQFWSSYFEVARASRKFEFNAGYHVMIAVIGVSTTAEYVLKGLYEQSIGRFAELTAAPPGSAAETPEDQLSARVARD
ncbi:hypothetical protein, partial [Klebsiella pneumoniae]|uniref:hypothetical protein n=1 Tax=Klebsiella pneumoniae TaxID=573 RepID=UPI002009DF6D